MTAPQPALTVETHITVHLTPPERSSATIGAIVTGLPAVLRVLETADRAGAAAYLRALCRAGSGTWIDPDCGRHAPTHMTEITLYGVYASGADAADAAENWIKVARTAARPEAESDA